MRYRTLTLASIFTATMLALVAAIASGRFPAGAQLPVHWNVAGEADRFIDATRALFMPVALCAALSLIMNILPRIEPMQNRMEASASLFKTSWAGLLMMMVMLELIIAAPAFGIKAPDMLPLAGTGILLILIGNALPKSRPGFFVGIRTPWTLMDPDNWIATHRIGAWTMIGGGGVILLTSLASIPPHARAIVVGGAIVFAVVPPMLYSYFHWRHHGRAR